MPEAGKDNRHQPCHKNERQHRFFFPFHAASRKVVHVDRFYPSSQLCHDCGYLNPEVKNLDVREWTCPQCGVFHDRDVNAANNLRDEGLRILGQLETAA